MIYTDELIIPGGQSNGNRMISKGWMAWQERDQKREDGECDAIKASCRMNNLAPH